MNRFAALTLMLAMAGHLLGFALAVFGLDRIVTAGPMDTPVTWLPWAALVIGLGSSLCCWIIATEQAATLKAGRR